MGPALSAIDQGFEVYVITDACGDVSEEAHERAVERIVQAGARPMTSLQYLLELQRDWVLLGPTLAQKRDSTHYRVTASCAPSRIAQHGGSSFRHFDRVVDIRVRQPPRPDQQVDHRGAERDAVDRLPALRLRR